MSGAGSYFLDDLRVGQTFETAGYTVDADAIREFAGRFDPQPFHLDEQAARGTVFAGLAASGWHTAAITMRLLVDGGLPFSGGLIGAGAEISWPNPVRPGDVLSVASEIVDLRPSGSKPDRGWATVRSETRTADGTVVQTLLARLLVFRRPTAVTA
ncbi:MAG: MaoC family dehydratase [Acetobacteraceae bacterium]|nr:MaoC family dehydratase [Acetobacteraceae bacterium]